MTLVIVVIPHLKSDSCDAQFWHEMSVTISLNGHLQKTVGKKHIKIVLFLRKNRIVFVPNNNIYLLCDSQTVYNVVQEKTVIG